jgi:DNA-directed RNA polymerase subunit beta
MACTSQRCLEPTTVRRYGSEHDTFPLPDLTELQTRSYAAFLQEEVRRTSAPIRALRPYCGKFFPSKLRRHRVAGILAV